MQPPSFAQKVLAFVYPVIPVVSGAVASWLLVHVHFLGLFRTASQVQELVSSAIVFAVTAAATWLSHDLHFLPITQARITAKKAGANLSVSLTQILAFVTPYISVAAGALAAWVFVHVHVLGIFHVTQQSLVGVISAALVFAVTTAVTWLAHNQHWLPIQVLSDPKIQTLAQ